MEKALLREKGATVVEYEADYSVAVEQGRQEAELDPMCHFIDDENSKDLFAGYAVAAMRLKGQLENMNVAVNATYPLFVYLPCGVGEDQAVLPTDYEKYLANMCIFSSQNLLPHLA